MNFLDELNAIATAAAKTETQKGRYNPRPAGVVRDGSASDAVLKFLRESNGFKTEGQLIWATKRSHSAVTWALIFLIRQGLVEAWPDPLRCSRYRKYRAVIAKETT